MDTTLIESVLERVAENPRIALAISGHAGHGKTAQVEAFCERENIPLIKIIASTLDESDLSGVIVPNHDTKTGEYYSLGMLDRATKERTVIFADEYNAARKEIQDAFLTLVESRHLPNGTPLHPDTIIIIAINPSVAYGNYEMSPASRNRFMWIENYQQTAKQWWANYGVEVPSDEGVRFMIDKLINEDGLEFTDDKGFTESVNTFTTPRSLTRLLQFSRTVNEVKAFAPSFVGKDAVALIDAYEELDEDIRGNAFFSRAKKETTSTANKKSNISGVKMTSLHNKVNKRLSEREDLPF